MAALTDTAIKAAKPTSKAFKLSDEKGLYLLIQPTGGKWWRFDYRFDGKRKTLSMGTYPDVNLKQARAYRDEARQLVANGTDPAELRKAEKTTISEAMREKAEAEKIDAMIRAGESLPGSFAAVAQEWAEKFLADKSLKYRDKVIRRLEVEVFPHIGRKPVDQVTAPDVLALLQRIESRGIFETTHRIKQNIGQVMRYAIATGRAVNEPTQALRGALAPNKANHLASLTEPKDIGPLLRVMSSYEGSPITKAALIIAPLVFVRPGELRSMEWAHIDWEANEWRYTTPKTKQDHIVPLAQQVVKTLGELQLLTGHARYVFPSARSDQRCMSDNTINAALKRLGVDTSKEITAHGFRAMARTVLEEVHGFRSEVIELQLAHAVRDPLGRAYNRTKHLETRKKMMQVWADYLDELRDSKNVIQGHFGMVG
ncbi:MAG: integrase [Halothiobacillus sp. 14-56-357]|jgi:integrase|uniref:tyrosine-type recombinase/integrase n=1 Tax=Halothiobacillus sp. 15-55-196 TaxID=1970382 RepID=UPI000BD3F279|nr:integrase arm-type DNA-binding domain-containing protein [Halothiobacillus sp. 15-55-196]OZB35158.1 MAG: integrase [Halothiobacillus sp. 15-55-196]OZB56690.1 MAG: integrase [Halothiobacillus sp. 14-56-357]OZB79268.1 MAG: integrase [Halothiobacillus sp. 13-55-115]